MKHEIKASFDLPRINHVHFYEAEVWMRKQVFHVLGVPGDQVVHSHNLIPVLEKAFAQV